MLYRFTGSHPERGERVLSVTRDTVTLTTGLQTPVGLATSFDLPDVLRSRLLSIHADDGAPDEKRARMLAALNAASRRRTWRADPDQAQPPSPLAHQGSGPYFLSVLQPIGNTGALKLTLLRVLTDHPLSWVREHADDLARQACGAGHVALMVDTPDTLPMDLRAKF